MITREALEAYQEYQSKINDKIDEIFALYTTKHGIHFAYGVESYDINHSTIDIKQDTSCRNCYDYTYYTVPLLYLFMTKEEIAMAIDEEVAIKREKERITAQAIEVKRKADKRAEYERLKKEFE